MKNLQDTLVKTIPGKLLLKLDVNAILENTAHDVDGIDVYNEKVEKYLKRHEKDLEYQFCWRELHKEEFAEYRRKYYKTHKDAVDERNRRWVERHKEEVAEYKRNYQKANADAIAEYKRRWAELHKENRAESWHKYYQLHKKEKAEYGRQYYEAHKEEKAEYFRRYREENKEIIAERNRRYREKNKEKLAEHRREYRAKKKAERLAALAQTLKNESTENTTCDVATPLSL